MPESGSSILSALCIAFEVRPILWPFTIRPWRDLHLDPGFLNSVGVFDRYAGMFERKLPDLRAGLFGLIEPLGGAADVVSGKGHGRAAYSAKKRVLKYV